MNQHYRALARKAQAEAYFANRAMLALKILTTILLVSLTAAVLIRDWRYHDRRTTKYREVTRWILWLYAIGGVGSVWIIWVETVNSGQQSKQIAELVEGKNQLLKNLESYQHEIRTKDARIEQLENTTEVLRDFGDTAKLDFRGMPLNLGYPLTYDSAIATPLRSLYEIKDDRIGFRFGQEYEEQYRNLITKFPRFPFTYMALADSLKLRGNGEWRTVATQAVEILKKTTQIEGHHESHDHALKSVLEKLQTQ